MKNKLIAIVITALLTGGIGSSVVFNKNHNKTADTEIAQVIEEENTSDNNIMENESEVIENNVDNNPEVVEQENSVMQEDKQVNNIADASPKASETVKAPVSQQSSQVNKAPASTNNSQAQQVNNTNTNVNNSENFMAQVEQLIYSKVNEQRAANGLSQLSYNNTMQKYARIKSKDMGDNNYFDHKDLSGNLITVKMQNDGVSYNAWAENIAYISGVSDANALADQFMTNWMNSEGHRKNILSTNVNSIGIGVYKIGNKVYATQEFYR